MLVLTVLSHRKDAHETPLLHDSIPDSSNIGGLPLHAAFSINDSFVLIIPSFTIVDNSEITEFKNKTSDTTYGMKIHVNTVIILI